MKRLHLHCNKMNYQIITVLLLTIKVQISFSSVEVTVTPTSGKETSVEQASSSTDSPSDGNNQSTTFSSESFTSTGIDALLENSKSSKPESEANDEDSTNQDQNEKVGTDTTTQNEEINININIPANSCDLLVLDESNCRNYYEICTEQLISSSNSSSVKSCPNETFFDSIDAKCVSEMKAYCGKYECSEPDGFFVDSTSRYSFIHCFDGKPKRKLCEPKGTVFFKESKICMWVPDEIPVGLKIFQAFIWLVKLGDIESTGKPDGNINSTEDYIKAAAVAVCFPIVYLILILALYKQINPTRPHRDVISDELELQDRYSIRPTNSVASIGEVADYPPRPAADAAGHPHLRNFENVVQQNNRII